MDREPSSTHPAATSLLRNSPAFSGFSVNDIARAKSSTARPSAWT